MKLPLRIYCLSFTLKIEVPPKHWHLCTRLHGVTCIETTLVIFTNLRLKSRVSYLYGRVLVANTTTHMENELYFLTCKQSIMWSRSVEKCSSHWSSAFFSRVQYVCSYKFLPTLCCYDLFITKWNYGALHMHGDGQELSFPLYCSLFAVILHWNENGKNFGICYTLYNEL
jgi:hypothetical protein